MSEASGHAGQCRYENGLMALARNITIPIRGDLLIAIMANAQVGLEQKMALHDFFGPGAAGHLDQDVPLYNEAMGLVLKVQEMIGRVS